MTRARTLLVVSAVLAAALVLLVQWRQAQLERESQELEAEREKLAAQIAELTERRDLLRELQALAASKEFYVVLWLGTRQVELRLEDRVLRRIPLVAASRLPTPGLHPLVIVHPERLKWGYHVEMTRETSGCSLLAHYCLVVAEEDFAALARLKPGAVLVVLP